MPRTRPSSLATPASRLALGGLAVAVGLSGCATSAGGGGDDGGDGTRVVLADAQPLGGYNPVNGYGEPGVSPLYDGLLRPASSGDDRLPELEPALAAEAPAVSDDSTVWDVTLREGVTFSDGTTLDAADVVATYEAVLDPESASEVAGAYRMIGSVAATDDRHVRFTLTHPYSAFASRLTLGIAPSERLDGGPARDSTLNTEPVGTGPYLLTRLDADQAVFAANPGYWGGAPQVTELVTLYLPDDNARAQRVRAGDVDGTVLPPVLAASFEDESGLRVQPVRTADWRGVSLPVENAFASDPAARRAMNLAVDRATIVDGVLAGHGSPAATPVSAVYGDAFAAGATFPFDRTRAERLLDDAGWRPAADGVRARDGERAEFDLYYLASDSLRRDMAAAFAADMATIGVDVTLRGGDWPELDRHLTDAAILLGGGERPYDLDTQLFDVLHTRADDTSPYDNPGDVEIPGVDAQLDRARASLDPDERTAAYRAVQEAYVQHPTHVFLAFVEHTYVTRDDDADGAGTGWDRGPLVLEPHAHGVSWGPWWHVAGWRR
ncbi:ABC transporter substrate-binding protein [Isoptericola sp. NPDC056605]|uniref:ABC transporter substrate-binding protein n=1 Tax=Isoptericola sp. NPDC056605 TaxID=3345876 RepID=UPI0036A5D44B